MLKMCCQTPKLITSLKTKYVEQITEQRLFHPSILHGASCNADIYDYIVFLYKLIEWLRYRYNKTQIESPPSVLPKKTSTSSRIISQEWCVLSAGSWYVRVDVNAVAERRLRCVHRRTRKKDKVQNQDSGFYSSRVCTEGRVWERWYMLCYICWLVLCTGGAHITLLE